MFTGFISAQPLPSDDSLRIGATERDFRNFEEEFRSFSLDMLRLNDKAIETVFSLRCKTLPPYTSFPGDTEPQTGFRYNRVDGLFIGLGSQKRYEVEDGFYIFKPVVGFMILN